MDNRISENCTDRQACGGFFNRDRLLKIFCSGKCGALLTFLAAFMLTRVTFFEQYAPLGAAFSAASNKKYSFAATAGAILGYLTVSGRTDGVKYIAATLLCFAAVHIFKDTDAFEYRVFMPFIASVSMFGVGFVFLLEQGVSVANVLLFALEISVTVCATWFYQDAQGFFSSGAPAWNMPSYGTLTLAFSILCAFSGFKIAGGISPLRIVAALFVMYAAAGLAKGAQAGFAAGALADMLYGTFPLFCVAYTAAGICGGAMAKKKNKWAFIAMFVISGCAAALWSADGATAACFSAEICCAAAIFAFLPAHAVFACRQSGVQRDEPADLAREYISKKLSDTANAFAGICDFLKTGINPERQNDENMRVAFEYAAEKVCRGCEICGACWEKDYVCSFNAFNDATAAIQKNGRAAADDYPAYFADRCLHFNQFREQVNRAASLMLRRRRYKAQARGAADIIRRQYEGASELFSELAEEIFNMPEYRPLDGKRANSVLTEYDPNCRASVFKNRQGALIIEIENADGAALKSAEAELCGRLSRALGRKFDRFSQQTAADSGRIIIREREKLCATVGVGMKKKHGQEQCGDNGAYFKTDDGTAYMLLSDGMGAGEPAAQASGAALGLFEGLLKSGIAPDRAFRAAAPALKIRSGTDGFSTIDIFSVNLTDGRASLLKCGAAQSYVKIGGRVSKIQSNALPVGLMDDEQMIPDVAQAKMGGGDLAVIMSDGVADDGEDMWVADMIRCHDAQSAPKELALKIIDGAVKRGSSDDITVLVMRLERTEDRECAVNY